jgi:hypothetical protein
VKSGYSLSSTPFTIFHQKQQTCAVPKLVETTMQKRPKSVKQNSPKQNARYSQICKTKDSQRQMPSRS